MRARIRFGPAGIPIQCKGGSTEEGVRCCSELGLEAMEMEFVQGVRMNADTAAMVKATAEECQVSLSSHAPYFINLCTSEGLKLANTRRHIISSARITSLAGGRITVFHPGFYQKLPPEKAYAEAKRNLAGIVEELKSLKISIRLGAETVGKKSSFGGSWRTSACPRNWRWWCRP